MLEYDDKQLRTMKLTFWGVKLFLWFYIMLVLAVILFALWAEFVFSSRLSDCLLTLQYAREEAYEKAKIESD